MDLVEEHYCVRWKGFHSNIVTALESLKTDEEFVDVSLSCDGRTIQGHKVILSACSPYFKKILRDNPCRHPVLILNDLSLPVLEALVTYMYHGTVSVPQHQLQEFLKTAEALRIKGIVDMSNMSNIDPPSPEQEPAALPVPVKHPAGDLSLLASLAATEPSAKVDDINDEATIPTANPAVIPLAPPPGVKRRKTAPRKLGTYLMNGAHFERDPYNNSGVVEQEEKEKENQDLMTTMTKSNNEENIQKSIFPVNLSKAGSMLVKTEGSLDLSIPRPTSPESSSPPCSPPSTTTLFTSGSQFPGTHLNLLSQEGATAADQMAALLGPEQMAALLGPSWKSRQPRMCQYCQRMFSNKFNLKQHILNMHTVGRELACEICQKKVKNKWYLRRHHVTHHGAPLKK